MTSLNIYLSNTLFSAVHLPFFCQFDKPFKALIMVIEV